MFPTGTILGLALAVAIGSSARAAPPTTRAEFAKAAAAIEPGTTAAEVERLLGKPDDIETERDPGGIAAARTVEIWRYGTRANAHLSFATLGAIHLQADHTVQYVFGNRGAPSARVLALGEAKLRPLLEAVAAVPAYDARLDPRLLVAAVNALQPLGKDDALAVLDEFLRVSSPFDDGGRRGVFLVLRALFDVPTGGFPPMLVGAPSPAPANAAALPRFPLAIVGDVPVSLVAGYALAGEAEPPEQDVAAFRKVGTLRAAPLAPTAASLDQLDAYVATQLPAAMTVDDQVRARVYDQALALFATVYRPGDATVDTNFPLAGNVAARWANARAAIGKLAPAWSAAHQRFELAHGATLPERPAGFPRVWWDVGLPAATTARVTFQRLDDAVVDVEVRVEVPPRGRVAADTVVLVEVGTQKQVGALAIAALAAPATSTAGSVTSTRLHLARGRAIRLHTAGGIAGPTLTP